MPAVMDALIRARSAEEFAESLPSGGRKRPALPVREAVFRSGLPVPALLADSPARARWFEGYVTTYLERDLRLLYAIEDLFAFRRFMQAAALRNGTL